jgi:cobalamin biosynthesis protein CobD/CbiB
MKVKSLNILLIFSSLLGYLEWGQNNSSFLFQIEFEVLNSLISDPKSTAHPFTLIPLLGQFLLIITLFQKKPNKWLTYTGIVCIGLLLGLMFFIGLSTLNLKILFSTLPFFLMTFLIFRIIKRNKSKLQIPK